MIVVKVELWPLGQESKARELHRGFIINDGTGTPDLGNYKVELNKKGFKERGKGVWKSWQFKGFKRKELLAWDLLGIALMMTMGPERIKKWSFKGSKKNGL